MECSPEPAAVLLSFPTSTLFERVLHGGVLFVLDGEQYFFDATLRGLLLTGCDVVFRMAVEEARILTGDDVATRDFRLRGAVDGD